MLLGDTDRKREGKMSRHERRDGVKKESHGTDKSKGIK